MCQKFPYFPWPPWPKISCDLWCIALHTIRSPQVNREYNLLCRIGINTSDAPSTSKYFLEPLYTCIILCELFFILSHNEAVEMMLRTQNFLIFFMRLLKSWIGNMRHSIFQGQTLTDRNNNQFSDSVI